MENLIHEKNSGEIIGNKYNKRAFGQEPYLQTYEIQNTNENRIIKRRKLKSRLRSRLLS